MALNFSDTDKAKYMTGQYKKEIKLYFPELSLTVLNDNIYAESMTLEESIFDGNGELSVVGCISNRFSIEIRNQVVQLKNKSIQVSIRIDNGSWNRIFTGYVESVETVRDHSYQKIQCFDALYKYQNKNFFNTYNALTFPITILNLRNALFNFMGITQESQSLPTDNGSIPKTIENGEISCLDAVRAICQMNGVFGRINAAGRFQYYVLETPSDYRPYPDVDVYPSEDFYPSDGSSEVTDFIDKYKSIKYEDYNLATITGVTVRDSQSDANEGQYGTTGNVLLIEGNMWCQGLGSSAKDFIAECIYNNVKNMVYQPFEATSIGLPWIECGDAVAYYVYDYSLGHLITDVMAFNVLSRYLKGIQWLEDTYTANGTEYQPEVKPVSIEGDSSQQISNLENSVSTLNSEVSDISSSLNNKQDTLTAGTGIDITDNVISATGGSGGIDYKLIEQDTGLKYTYIGQGGVQITQKVYQITFDDIVLATDGSFVKVDVSALDPLTIISMDAMVFQNVGGQALYGWPAPYYQSADNYCFIRTTHLFNVSNDIYIWSKLALYSTMSLTIRYIKTVEPQP